MNHPGVKRLHIDEESFAILTPQGSRSLHNDVKDLINRLGVASSRAQGLKHIITQFQSFASGDNKIYLLIDEENSQALGFIKVGFRNLFLWDRLGVQHEKKLLCLLDFFTHPDCQRKGYGRKMIDKMLADQHLEMKQIPIDRPSALCLSFMKKHFGLSEYMPQSNQFVVFDQFWESHEYFNKNNEDKFAYKPPKPLLTPSRPKAQPQIFAPTFNKVTRTPKRSGLNPITWAPYD